jgi:serine/threonine-protein kinase RsbW
MRNDLNDLQGVAAATTEFLETNRTSREVIFAANLAIEEMVSNTVKYGYRDTLQHQIDIQLSLGTNVLEIEICDDGGPFDPFAYPEPRPSSSGEERQGGGLGIHFVRNILDGFNYVRREGQNIVRLTKKL